MDRLPVSHKSLHWRRLDHPHFWISNPTCKTLSTLSSVVLQTDNCYDWLHVLQLFILSKSCISLEQPPPWNCGLIHLGAVQPSRLQDWPCLTIEKHHTFTFNLNITCILSYFIFSRCILVTHPFFFLALLIFLQLDALMSRSQTGVWHYWKIDRYNVWLILATLSFDYSTNSYY